MYVKTNQQPPMKLSRPSTRKTYSGLHPTAFNAVKEGKYVVVWGVSGKDSGTVLAYEKAAPEKGGAVLMADGTIKTMTADELKAAIQEVARGRHDPLLVSAPLVPLATLLLSATTGRAELPPLIPRKVLFGNPTKASPLISPDGKRLAFLAPDKNEVLQVWVRTIGKDDAKQVTADKKRGIRIHLWSYAPDVLLYMQDNDGDENYHLYSVDLKEDVVRDLTPFQGVRAGQPIDLNVTSIPTKSSSASTSRIGAGTTCIAST